MLLKSLMLYLLYYFTVILCRCVLMFYLKVTNTNRGKNSMDTGESV